MSLLGDRLRKAREQKRYSQTEVFRRTKINNKTLSRYENGGSEPDVETLNILASLYNVNVDWLTGRTDIPFEITDDNLDDIKRKLVEEVKTMPDEDVKYLLDLAKRIRKD